MNFGILCIERPLCSLFSDVYYNNIFFVGQLTVQTEIPRGNLTEIVCK